MKPNNFLYIFPACRNSQPSDSILVSSLFFKMAFVPI